MVNNYSVVCSVSGTSREGWISSCIFFLKLTYDPTLEKVVKGEKRKARLFKFQTKMCLNTI